MGICIWPNFSEVIKFAGDVLYGAVQLLRNVFLANFDPPPLVTKCHTGPTPPPLPVT